MGARRPDLFFLRQEGNRAWIRGRASNWRRRAPDSSALKSTLPLEGSSCAWRGESASQAKSAEKANDPKKNISPWTSWGPQVDEEDERNPISTVADQLSPTVGANCCGYRPNNRYKGSDGAMKICTQRW